MKWKPLALQVSSLLLLGVLISGCTGPSPFPATNGTGVEREEMVLQVDSLAPGATLPMEYTCAGAGISPPIYWTDVPRGTQSLVLILHDPDAPLPGGFTHWIVYNIPPGSTGLPGNVSSGRELPGGVFQGQNSLGTNGYVPACPPVGSAPHHYVFTVHALNTTIDNPNPNRTTILADLSEHTIAEAQVVMMFSR